MELIQSESHLSEVAGALAGEPLLAADTEAAGFHRYDDRICLLQLSSREQTYVVDALALARLDALRGVFSEPGVEVIFHDADYDLRLLHRDFGLTVADLFDTKVAAQFLGEVALGLGSLTEKYLGVVLEKKYQRADWAQRPLPRPMLEYAAEDTRYLPPLRDALRAELVEKGRLGWAMEEFRILETSARWMPQGDGHEAYHRLKGTRDLRPRQLAALREVYEWRESTARERDVAPFRVVSNEVLIEVARRMPETRRALADVPGLPRAVLDRYDQALLAAIKRARNLGDPQLPLRPRGQGRPPLDPEFEALVDRLKAARDRAAERLQLERGFLMPRAQLEEIARAWPRTYEELGALPGIRRWQVEAASGELLTVLNA